MQSRLPRFFLWLVAGAWWLTMQREPTQPTTLALGLRGNGVTDSCCSVAGPHPAVARVAAGADRRRLHGRRRRPHTLARRTRRVRWTSDRTRPGSHDARARQASVRWV